jgi:hypothetical protein
MVLNGMDGYVYVAAPKGDSCPNFLEEMIYKVLYQVVIDLQDVVVYFTNQGLTVTGF